MNSLDHLGPQQAELAPLLTIDEVVGWLRMSKSTLYRAIRAGHLPAFKVLGVWRIDRRDVETFLQERKSSYPASTVGPKPEGSGR